MIWITAAVLGAIVSAVGVCALLDAVCGPFGDEPIDD